MGTGNWELVECPERVGRPDTVGRPESLHKGDGSVVWWCVAMTMVSKCHSVLVSLLLSLLLMSMLFLSVHSCQAR